MTRWILPLSIGVALFPAAPAPVVAAAQGDAVAPDTVRVAVVVDAPADTLALGAPFELSVGMVRPDLDALRLETERPRLAPFELDSWRRELDRGDTAMVVLTLRPFRVGRVALPPLRLVAGSGDGAICVGESDTLAFQVASVVPDSVVAGALQALMSPGAEPGRVVGSRVRDIHESRPLSRPRPLWPFILAAVIVAALVLAAIWYRRRVRDELLEAAAVRPAHESALEALQRLGASELAREGPWKGFYTELTEILRTYLARRFGVDAPDMTTTETLRALRRLDPPGEAMAALRELLEDADRVKFARGAPAAGLPRRHLDLASEFVRLTRPAPAPAVEPEGAAA